MDKIKVTKEGKMYRPLWKNNFFSDPDIQKQINQYIKLKNKLYKK